VAGWQLDLIKPSNIVADAIYVAWAGTMQDMKSWTATMLVPSLLYGGLGIQGLALTPFYKFISSPDGLSQLGIEDTEPQKLLDAYEKSVLISSNNTLMMLRFGDTATLKLGTPHPATGTGHLQITSWMEWILDGVVVDSGFVPRKQLPTGSQKGIRISSAPGGLMLAKGVFNSPGLWRFPTNLQDYDTTWLQTNAQAIEHAVINQAIVFLNKRLK